VPAKVAVPLPLSVKVTPAGSAPDSDSAGVGTPVAVTVKLAAAPTGKLADAALVNAGAWPTAIMRLCVAVPAALVAETVIQ
jgi:hypothetical protein